MCAHTRLAAALLVLFAVTAGVPVAAKAPEALDSIKLALRTRDYPTALAQLQRSATGGNPQAQLLLGLVHLNGVGTKVNQAAAENWLAKSAAQGNATACYVLAALYARRIDAAPGEAQALLRKAAALGYPEAAEDLRAGRAPLSPDWAGLSDTTLRDDLAIYSARNADLDCLLAMGAAVKDLRDPFGSSLLAHAVAGGALKSAQLLIDAGSDVNHADNFGVTPLMLAARLESTQLLELLLSKGASVSAVDQAKRTALFYAARANRSQAVAKLVQAGAKFDVTDSRDYTALDAALSADADQAAAQLRSLGAKSLVAHAARESNVGKFDVSRPGDLYRGWPPVALAVARNDAANVRGFVARSGSSSG
jgi:flagellum-specific peptidoglycan hydrolase FlgJ